MVKSWLVARPARVRRRHGDGQGGFGFVIEALPGLELELVADHLEAEVIDRKDMAVARVGIAGRQSSHDRAGRVLVDARIIQRNRCGGFVQVVDRDGEDGGGGLVWLVARPPASVAVTVTATVSPASWSRLSPALSSN